MKSNVGKSDRIFRVVLGISVALAGFYFNSWWGLLAIVPIATAYLSFCPLYSLFGISTCTTKAK